MPQAEQAVPAAPTTLKNELRTILELRFKNSVSPDLLAHLSNADDFVLACCERGAPPGGRVVRMDALTWPVVEEKLGLRLAVRDDDLDLIAQLVTGVASTGAVGAFLFVYGGVPLDAGTLCSIVANSFLFFRKLRRKLATLSPLQYQVLRGLKSRSDGMSLDQLEGWLAWTKVPALPEDVEKVLLELSQFRLGDGTVATLVNCDSSGRWSAAGI